MALAAETETGEVAKIALLVAVATVVVVVETAWLSDTRVEATEFNLEALSFSLSALALDCICRSSFVAEAPF